MKSKVESVALKPYAMILGASSGFGGAIALELAKEGYNIIGLHLDRKSTMPNVEKIIDAIKAEKVQAIFYNVNAADAMRREEIIEELKELFNGQSRIKVLVHSLAFGALRPLISYTSDPSLTKPQIEMTLDVMANSLVYWTQDLVHNNLFMKGGKIFALTSSGNKTVIPNYGAVSAAKAALEAYIRQLAVELGPLEISAMAIMAGVTDTPALRKIPGSKEMIDIALKKNPRKRLTKPEYIGKVVRLLCQEGAEWISGCVIHSDGGEDIVNYIGQK